MTNLSVIEAKISSIRKYLKILRSYGKYSQEEIERDFTLKGAVERYLYLICQSTLDLAEATIAYKKFRRPGSYSECFYILKEEDYLSGDLNEKMVRMAGFRNFIAHDYEDIDFAIVYDILKNRLVDIDDFTKIVKKKLNL